MESKASLDTLGKIITSLTFVLVLGIIIKFIYLLQTHNDIRIIYYWSCAIFILFLIITISYLFSPKKYVIKQKDLLIKRIIGSKIIHIADIADVKQLSRADTRFLIRYFGVGGLFGWYGKFWNRKYGKMTFYASKRKNLIMIKTKRSEKIVISPDNFDFINEIIKIRN